MYMQRTKPLINYFFLFIYLHTSSKGQHSPAKFVAVNFFSKKKIDINCSSSTRDRAYFLSGQSTASKHTHTYTHTHTHTHTHTQTKVTDRQLFLPPFSSSMQAAVLCGWRKKIGLAILNHLCVRMFSNVLLQAVGI